MTDVLDPYKVLGVAPNVGMPAVKRAYKVELKKCHPDVVVGSGGIASSRFSEVVEAFQILCDPVLRAEYDKLIAAERQAKAAMPLKPAPPPSRGVALARAGIAIVELGFWGGISLLFLLVLVVGLIEAATGK